MRILLTGASSFTGCWFAYELARQGHELVMPLRRARPDYDGVRSERVELAGRCGELVFECPFGSERLDQVIACYDHWDMLAHHAAEVRDYKSADFDVAAAVQNNTWRVKSVLEAMVARDCRYVVGTGSVFEPGEGAGSEGLPAFSPYGLSKALTSQMLAYYARSLGMTFGKFTISNPFGPFEEPRFTQYLVRTWAAGETARVRTPDYVRDNIPVSLLAKSYGAFVSRMGAGGDVHRLNPSGYVEAQGRFAQRFAEEMRGRLNLACELTLDRQTQFAEPRMRINTDPPDVEALGWDEAAAWDELAEYYRHKLLSVGQSARSAT